MMSGEGLVLAVFVPADAFEIIADELLVVVECCVFPGS